MNNIQNISKRIRKRIQNSVKRLFTSKSSNFETSDLQTNLVGNGKNEGDKRQSSYTIRKNYYDDNLNRNEDDQTIIEIKSLNEAVKYEENVKPKQYGEEISEKNVQVKYSVSNSSESESYSKNISKSISEGSINFLTCPLGRHVNLKDGESCICISTKQLLHYQKMPVLYEWHKFKSQPIALSLLKLTNPNVCVHGGQGVVFKTYDPKNNRNFALKMKLRGSKSNNSWLIERRESNMLKEIQHNFIVSLFHVHETENAMFMTMEYLDGGCLWSHIAKKGTLPESYTIYYSACILNALQHLHQKDIVYRDLKAENVALDGHGRPKLIDFGMAKRITISDFSKNKKNREEENYPATQYYYAAYLAPEIYSRPSCANFLIDSWGLGYIISEILLGYGIFLSMPWEKVESNLKEDWKFQYNDKFSISKGCTNFLENMLKNNSNARMSLEEAVNHQFFQHVHWSKLVYIKPPDLSIFRQRSKGSGIIQAVADSKFQVSSFFEIYDFHLPDPLLTPSSNNQCDVDIINVSSPKDTPINPNAPSIRLPILIKKDSFNYNKYSRVSNNLKYDIYRALHVKNSECHKMGIDTLSNLRPIRRF